MFSVKILRNSQTLYFFRRARVQTFSTNYDNFGSENFDNLCTCSNNLHYFFKNKDLKVFIIFKILNFHIKNLTNSECFGWPLYSGPFSISVRDLSQV